MHHTLNMKHSLFLLLYFIVFLPIGQGWGGTSYAQFIGGIADGHTLVSKTDVVVCTLPTYVNISNGGIADGHTLVAKTDVVVCTLPTYVNISNGGIADGHTLVAKTDVVVCILPTYVNISKGGIADGYAIVSKTDVVICTLPTYVNISIGGIADGYAIVSKTDVVVCTLPTYVNISKGGIADGYALVSKTDVVVCTLPTYVNISKGGIADGYALVSKTDVVVCILPTYVNISKGGIADGYALVASACLTLADWPNVGINVIGASPHISSILDVDAITLNNKGVLFPRLTDVQRSAIAAPATGLLIYNTTSNQLNNWNGSQWVELTTTSIAASNPAGTNNGPGLSISTIAAIAHHSALLDVQGTTGGVLVPRMTTNERNSIGGPIATSLIIYNTTNNRINYYDDDAVWGELCGVNVSGTTGAVSNSQNVAINLAGTVAVPSALLDISSTTRGVLIPRLTTLQRDAILSPAQGLLMYNIDTRSINIYNGSTAWLELFSTAGPAVNAASSILSTSFQANWTTSAGATNYYLDVSTSSTFANFVGLYTNLDVGTAISQSVTGLSSATIYYYRLRKLNSCGGSTSSKTITLTTP